MKQKSKDDAIRAAKDKKRDEDLALVGFMTLRFSSWVVLNQIDDVAIMIGEWIDSNTRN